FRSSEFHGSPPTPQTRGPNSEYHGRGRPGGRPRPADPRIVNGALVGSTERSERLVVEAMSRHREAHFGAALGPGLGPDMSAHRVDEVARHEEANAGASGLAGHGRRPIEQFEHVRHVLFGDS